MGGSHLLGSPQLHANIGACNILDPLHCSINGKETHLNPIGRQL